LVLLKTLLKREYNVIGVTMNLFGGEAFHEAKTAAEHFMIPHYTVDLSERFRNIVIDSFVQSYTSGKTPNPCVVCNKHIKFGALLDYAASIGCELMATGHYARVEFDSGSSRYLLKKAGSEKDQSYVLYGLSQKQLSRVVFPLGELNKAEVREIAYKYNLSNRDKPDSQDICFVPDGDYAAFIANYTGETPEPGPFLTREGNVIGQHKGLIHYTVGQRKGLGIAWQTPLYVCEKNANSNTVTLCESDFLFSPDLEAVDFNWIINKPDRPFRAMAKIRYRQKATWARVTPEADRVHIHFNEPQRAAAKGQHVVLYEGDTVLGGGVIT
jgi:tRNA-specific 2-thiouridylase